MYGCTALPWIGPGRTSATCTVRSSRFSGCVRSRLCICARLSIWKTPTVSAAWISAYTAGSSSGTRERSIGSPWRRAIWSTASSTAESIPSPSRSILRKPASEHESLSHWQICRPAIAAGWTGTRSISGRVEIDHPARVLGDVARQAGDLARQLAERVPARAGVRAGDAGELLADAARVPAVGDAREPLELARTEGRAPCRRRGSRRGCGRSRSSRRARRARGRSAR